MERSKITVNNSNLRTLLKQKENRTLCGCISGNNKIAACFKDVQQCWANCSNPPPHLPPHQVKSAFYLTVSKLSTVCEAPAFVSAEATNPFFFSANLPRFPNAHHVLLGINPNLWLVQQPQTCKFRFQDLFWSGTCPGTIFRALLLY